MAGRPARPDRRRDGHRNLLARHPLHERRRRTVRRRQDQPGAEGPRRAVLLRHLPAPAQPAQGAPALAPPGARRTQRQAGRQVHLQLLGVPEPAGHLGHRPGAADHPAAPPGRRAPAPRRAAGPDLRLRRQDQPVRRRAEHRDQHAGARSARGRGLPAGRVPGGRLPGNPRRHAQPVRRHRLGERLPA
ncbi:hypothetical protein D9M68_746160 [compost metagenome]